MVDLPPCTKYINFPQGFLESDEDDEMYEEVEDTEKQNSQL